MKKTILLFLVAAIVMSLCACGSPISNKGETQSQQNTNETKKSSNRTYATILEEYTIKLQEATPKLINEYTTEAAKNTEGLQGLASLCTDKVSELAEISTDGIQEMAQLMLYSGSGSYDEYQEWANKLQEIYMVEAGKIQDVYMDSAT